MAQVVKEEPKDTVIVEKENRSNTGIVVALVVLAIIVLLILFGGSIFGGAPATPGAGQ